MERAKWILAGLLVLVAVGAVQTPLRAEAPESTATPKELVATYRTLADTILGANKTESNLVASILSTTYHHAEATLAMVHASLKARKPAKAELEKLAALVAQLGNEGDAAVGGVRKRLVEGGHHHNAAEEHQGTYDEGFVIVTRSAKKVFLEAAGNIGKMTESPKAAALDAEWQKVKTQYTELMTAR
jgi:hypothetical protein